MENDSTPKLKCKRCYGRGFYFKSNGFTLADRTPCHKCEGLGKVTAYRVKTKKPKAYSYQYSKEGMTE